MLSPALHSGVHAKRLLIAMSSACMLYNIPLYAVLEAAQQSGEHITKGVYLATYYLPHNAQH